MNFAPIYPVTTVFYALGFSLVAGAVYAGPPSTQSWRPSSSPRLRAASI